MGSSSLSKRALVVLLAAGLLFASWLACRRGTREYGHVVVNRYPHDPTAYCQGLVYHEGELLESTGQFGASSLRRTALETGEVQQAVLLNRALFGEGLVLWEERLIQLTWKAGRGLVFDRATFELVDDFRYSGEGWGITHDGQHLVMSDGTSELRFLDPVTYEEVRRVQVLDRGEEVHDLNELEFVRGEVFANVWRSNRIARIDPTSGEVTGWIDCTGLLGSYRVADPRDDVLNGIAYDSAGDRLFVTGKHWPTLFEIDVVPR